MDEFPYGEAVVWPVQFVTIAGTVVDPTTVTFSARGPSGTQTDYESGTAPEVARTLDANNDPVYTLTVLPSSVGDWQVRVATTGNIVTAREITFRVLATDFT